MTRKSAAVGSLFRRVVPVADLDRATLCQLLANDRRVLAIEAARDRDVFDTKTLAIDISSQLETTQQSVYVTLLQTHIEKLIDADVFAGDPYGELRRGSNFDAVLDVLDELERRTSGGRR